MPAARRSRLKVRVAVERDGHLLCVQHGRPGTTPFWCLPGGNVDAGEALVTTARRELLEETGAEIEPSAVLMVLDDPEARNGDGVVELLMRGDLTGGEPALVGGSGDPNLLDVAWFPLDRLPEDLRPPALRELIVTHGSLTELPGIALREWVSR
jgi:8-oxo-dGTP diphosphatase